MFSLDRVRHQTMNQLRDILKEAQVNRSQVPQPGAMEVSWVPQPSAIEVSWGT